MCVCVCVSWLLYLYAMSRGKNNLVLYNLKAFNDTVKEKVTAWLTFLPFNDINGKSDHENMTKVTTVSLKSYFETQTIIRHHTLANPAITHSDCCISFIAETMQKGEICIVTCSQGLRFEPSSTLLPEAYTVYKITTNQNHLYWPSR